MLRGVILLGLFTLAAAAQTNAEAIALLNEIATSALATKGWRVEGLSTATAAGSGAPLSRAEFKIARQGRIKTRLEILGPNPLLVVCDGVFQTAYFQKSGGLTKTTATEERCADAFFRWETVADSIRSVEVRGHAFVPFDGRNQECTVIRAEYDRPDPWPLQRTFCIDPVRKIILRDQTETGPPGSRSITTITYTTIEREPVLSASLFQFDTPGRGRGPVLPPDRPATEARVYHVGEVSAPVPIRVVKASYTDEARRLRISGTVELSVQIDASGLPVNIKVVRGLGHGLDEKAIQAVRESQFRPTLKDGRPVIVEMTIGVGFDLN